MLNFPWNFCWIVPATASPLVGAGWIYKAQHGSGTLRQITVFRSAQAKADAGAAVILNSLI
jgi:hypothetical protein